MDKNIFEDLLKPCPFCNGEADYWVGSSYYDDGCKIYCTECFVETTWYKEISEAFDAWNKRV